jgi:hypothetical protein
MWDLWWTKWHWGRFSPTILVSSANSHSTACIIIIYHLGLVQQTTEWPQCQVDSVSPHDKNKNNNINKLTNSIEESPT